MKTHSRLLIAVLLAVCASVSAKVNIIPLPGKVVEGQGVFRLQDGQSISTSDRQIDNAAWYLRRVLTRATGLDIRVKRGKADFRLELLKPVDAEDESYTLDVTEQGVVIRAHSYKGIVGGIASVRQLLPPEIEQRTRATGVDWTMPVVSIQDKPAYHWRGLMLDPVRHFYSVEETERLIDQMALYKFNKFHWHLTDGVAWRIQIRQYPLLTAKGAWREMRADIDEACEQRAVSENDPAMHLPEKYFRTVDGKRLYGGFYTADDIREVVNFAAVRGIDVVPEIDMPGHNWMATQCYPWLSCAGDGSDPLCLGKESTLEFCKNVYKEIFGLFPYEYVHIGGDEVDRGRWSHCADCQKRIGDNSLADVNELQAWFTKYMERFFNSNGKKLMGWDEILEGGVSQTATVYWWRGDHPDVAQRSTEMGNEVVVCPTTFCYFDYGQDSETIHRLYTGDIVPADLNPAQHRLIKGIQANIWCEYIPSEARMQYMAFPRALALAEKAWTPKAEQNWQDFSARLQHMLPRLKAAGVNFRPL